MQTFFWGGGVEPSLLIISPCFRHHHRYQLLAILHVICIYGCIDIYSRWLAISDVSQLLGLTWWLPAIQTGELEPNPPSSPGMSGWKIPELDRGLNGKMIYKWRQFRFNTKMVIHDMISGLPLWLKGKSYLSGTVRRGKSSGGWISGDVRCISEDIIRYIPLCKWLIPPVVSSCLWNIPTYGIHGEKLWVKYIYIYIYNYIFIYYTYIIHIYIYIYISDPKSDIMWTIHRWYLRNGMVEMTGMDWEQNGAL